MERPLTDASRITSDIHYRVRAVDNAELLGFGTCCGSLARLMDHVQRIQAAHPGKHLAVQQYDGAAGEPFDLPVGP